MSRRYILALLLIGLPCFFYSCAPTPSFTEANVEAGLADLLQKEFDLPALVKMTDNSLAACITVPNLFSAQGKGWAVSQSLIWQVRHCMHRVLMSTRAPIEFYQLTLRGDEADMELGFLFYLKDYQLFQLSAISRGDYGERQVTRQGVNLASAGMKRLRLFFKDLGNQNAEHIIRTHFAQDVKSQNIAADFVSWLWESSMKMDVYHQILDTRMRALDEKHFLFYIRVREIFERKHGFEAFPFSVTSGEEREFLVEIQTSDGIRGLISKLFLKDMKEADQLAQYKELINLYGSPKSWPESDFFAYETTLPEFMASQVANSLQIALSERNIEEDPNEAEALFPKISGIRGKATDDEMQLIFIYRDIQEVISDKDRELALDVARGIIQKYHYSEFKTIKMGTLSGGFQSYPVSLDL